MYNKMHIFRESNLMSLTYVYTCEIILIGNIMTILIKVPRLSSFLSILLFLFPSSLKSGLQPPATISLASLASFPPSSPRLSSFAVFVHLPDLERVGRFSGRCSPGR